MTTDHPTPEDAAAWHLVADLAAVAGDRERVCAVITDALAEHVNIREAGVLLATVLEFTYADCLTEPVNPHPKGKTP